MDERARVDFLLAVLVKGERVGSLIKDAASVGKTPNKYLLQSLFMDSVLEMIFY
jgi:hypothetical protein